MEYIKVTKENIEKEHICCAISNNKDIQVSSKKAWLSERFDDGLVFYKSAERGKCFIEYIPAENAWVPIEGDNFCYIYCLWVQGAPKGCGYGRSLMEYCINDAKKNGKSGICMLGAKKQKNWLSDQNFAKKFGFETADETNDGYELLSLSFDGSKPRFSQSVKQEISEKSLVIYYDYQCPYIYQRIEKLKTFCAEKDIDAKFVLVNSLETAKNLPCVFNNFAVFFGGEFVTVNQIDGATAEKIIKKYSTSKHQISGK